MNIISKSALSLIESAAAAGCTNAALIAQALLGCAGLDHFARDRMSHLIRNAYALQGDGLAAIASLMSDALRAGKTTEYSIANIIKLASVLCSTEPALQSVGLRWKLNSDATVTVVARAERAKRAPKPVKSPKPVKPEATKPDTAKGLDWAAFGRAVLSSASLSEPRDQTALMQHAELIGMALQSFTATSVAKPERQRKAK